MKEQIVYRNPNLIISQIQDGFVVVANTIATTNGIRLLNKKQFEVFCEFDSISSVDKIAKRLNCSIEDVTKLVEILEQNQIVSLNNSFKEPQWNPNPQSLNLWIHTTNKCNLGCEYCYISTLQTTGGMSEDIIKQLEIKLLQTAINRNLKSVKLKLAGGEPLLQFKYWKPFIVSMFEKFKDIDCSFNVAFLTNLTYLDDDIIEFSQKYNIGFGVSLDGHGNYHDLTRKFHNGKGSFEKVQININRLIASKIFPYISTVVTQKNMEGLPELTKYLIDSNLYFRYSIVHGEYIDRKRLSHILTECYDIMEDAIFKKDFAFFKKHRLCDLKHDEIFFQTCSAGFSGGAIYVDGGMYFCHVKFGDKDESGNIFQDEDLLSIIQKGQKHLGERSNDCMTCKYRYVCTSGCPMYRENGKDPSCGLYHEHLPRFYELIGKERLHKIKKLIKSEKLNLNLMKDI